MFLIRRPRLSAQQPCLDYDAAAAGCVNISRLMDSGVRLRELAIALPRSTATSVQSQGRDDSAMSTLIGDRGSSTSPWGPKTCSSSRRGSAPVDDIGAHSALFHLPNAIQLLRHLVVEIDLRVQMSAIGQNSQ